MLADWVEQQGRQDQRGEPLIWTLLALLGIPLWFIAVVLIAAFRNRNAVRSSPDVFEFKLKKGDGWARRKSFARWVGPDVSLLRR